MKDFAPSAVGYVDQTSTIQSVSTLAGVRFESDYFSPFGYDGNLMVMRILVTNTSGAPATVDVFANPNFHLGTASDPSAPGADGESIVSAAGLFSETGPGGGAMVYLPVGSIKPTASGTGFARVRRGRISPARHRAAQAETTHQVFQKSLGTLAAGTERVVGAAIQFASDGNAAAAQSAITTFLAGRRSTLFTDVQAEWKAWRKPPPAGLVARGARVFRQAEAVLRMAQVREPWSEAPKQKALGMILASLPPGQWHIGWVRDATYSIVALTRLGPLRRGEAGARFFLDAEADKYQAYAGVPYRISVVPLLRRRRRRSRTGTPTGPNVEFDGWGLYLWAARTYLDRERRYRLARRKDPRRRNQYSRAAGSRRRAARDHNLDSNGR